MRRKAATATGIPHPKRGGSATSLLVTLCLMMLAACRWHSLKQLTPPDTRKAPQDAPLSESGDDEDACGTVTLPDWLQLLDHQHERKVFSQKGEDGITEYLVQHVNIPNKVYVEFGTESGAECNTRVLRENHGWTGLLMDGSHSDESINLHREMINPTNIVGLLQKHGFPPETEIGYFSEDTDICDFHIWRSILEAGYRPRILISEVNPNFEPFESGTVVPPAPDETRFWSGDRDNYFGVSALALKRLWNAHGYVMVHCTELQFNCFGVRADLILGDGERSEPAITPRRVTQLQNCLWTRRKLAERVPIHPCDDDFELYVVVHENGEMGDPPMFFIPQFLQQCYEEKVAKQGGSSDKIGIHLTPRG